MKAKWLGLLAMTAVACGGASTDAESAALDESRYTVTPTGGAAQLLVTTPANPAIAPYVTARRDQQASQTVTIGTPKALTPGDYCVNVQLPIPNATHVVERCSVPVKAASTTTFAMGGLSFTRTSTAKVLGVDVPFRQIGYNGALGAADPTVAFLATSGLVPYPAGKFELGPFVSGTLADGESKSIALDDAAGRFSLTIAPADPATRSLPDVPTTNGIAFGLYSFNAYSYSTGTAYALTERFTRVDAPLFFATRGDVGAGSGPRLAVFGAASNPSGNNYTSGVLLSTSALNEAPRAYKLARLDVADVSVTMVDGSKKSVRGTFSVSGSYTTLVSNAPTGHGLDLPVGRYDVVVTYASPVDNTTASYTESVTLQ